jgi:hypothetical protein
MQNQREYVEKRYQDMIGYYWHVAVRNKRAYKWSRYMTIVLGSLVTLVASLSSAGFVQGHTIALAIATPVLAALLTVVGSFAQSFQWGATWREMVLSAERLQKELDRVRLSPDDPSRFGRDIALLNELVIRESSGFFDRLMGSSTPGNSPPADRQQPQREPATRTSVEPNES